MQSVDHATTCCLILESVSREKHTLKEFFLGFPLFVFLFLPT